MKVFRSLDAVTLDKPAACAIGMFDGVHLGHRMVLEQALRMSKIHHLTSVVFTFANHPQSVLSQTPTPLLSSLQERLDRFEALGFDAALVLDFTSPLKDFSAEEFIQRILMDTLNVRAVSVGYDHRFGKGRQGDGAFLKSQGETLGFEVEIVDPVEVDHQIVSSTVIRKLLSFGDLERANQLLGHPYTLTGKVVTGVGRGKTIGFPTANLELPTERLIPAHGVYAGTVTIDKAPPSFPAVCNIGVSPTFGDQVHPRMEVHLLDDNLNLYGKTLKFTFLHRLREEISFPSTHALIDQLNHDCTQAKQLLTARTDLNV